ncbi:MAG: hypothetical protein PHQ47_03950 [Candidatus Portnoybacteria bacterium]|nr:hypothetical protein [Candidatus Portnoybacteria bacterium]
MSRFAKERIGQKGNKTNGLILAVTLFVFVVAMVLITSSTKAPVSENESGISFHSYGPNGDEIEYKFPVNGFVKRLNSFKKRHSELEYIDDRPDPEKGVIARFKQKSRP